MSDGATLAVAYGPVEYLDSTALTAGGAFAALVDLRTGHVSYPAVRPTYGYFSPSCGADDTATYTSFTDNEAQTATVSVRADGTAASAVAAVPGEVTSAVHLSDGETVGILGSSIVTLRGGAAHRVADAGGAAYNLHPVAGGALVYAVDGARSTAVKQLLHGRTTTLVTAARGGLAVDQTQNGVVVHGVAAQRRAGAAHVTVAAAPASYIPSAAGSVFTSISGMPDMATGARVTVTGGSASSTETLAATVNDSSPVATEPTGVAARANGPRQIGRPSVIRPHGAIGSTSSVTTDSNLPCAVQRNDVKTEAYQPTVQQVEYAVDRAVAGTLTTSRAAGYRGYGLGAYSAQGLEPRVALTGGGTVPPQIMLGILANESNLWQASSHVTTGGYGNPLTGNIYGRDYDTGGALAIDFSHADCGYGIAQVTDGMRKGNQTASTQRAIALDYQVNIAAGLNILIKKWNQLKSLGITMNGSEPSGIENWYAAAWAYNSGLQPNSDNGNTTGCSPSKTCTDSAGYWGLGWANNPANPLFKSHRALFNQSGTDAATPYLWPYQERVIGWAAYPIYKPEGHYAQAYWTSDANRTAAIPDPSKFCTSANHCTPGKTTGVPGTCGLSNLHCWVHYPVSWHNCSASYCGFGQTTYTSSDPEPADGKTQDPADCAATLGSSAVIVDDIPSSSPSPAAPCHSLTTGGSFAFTFSDDGNGNYPAHIDLHQINGGLNGHYWFTHGTGPDLTSETGTWTFPTTVTGWGRLMVHLPAAGAQTEQASYTVIDGATAATQQRVVNQYWGTNHWASLGAVNFTAGEKVRLSSVSASAVDEQDVAWDAVAFVPISAPRYKVVGLGDSYSSGEGNDPYLDNSDTDVDKCHRSPKAYVNLVTLPDASKPLGMDPNDELDFVACSGAHTSSISPSPAAVGDEIPPGTGWGQRLLTQGEWTQAEQGYLDARTDAVTLSIGGNDARFADIIKSCSISGLGIHECSEDGYVMDGDPSPLNQLEPHLIRDLLPSRLKAVYTAISTAAPNATIFVVGYPRLFPTDASGRLNCPVDMTVKADDQVWLNSMADLLNASTSSVISGLASQGMKIHFIDPTAAFSGHDICSDDAYINAIVNTPVNPGPGSFHPKANGQAAYAQLVTAAMKQYLPAK